MLLYQRLDQALNNISAFTNEFTLEEKLQFLNTGTELWLNGVVKSLTVSRTNETEAITPLIDTKIFDCLKYDENNTFSLLPNNCFKILSKQAEVVGCVNFKDDVFVPTSVRFISVEFKDSNTVPTFNQFQIIVSRVGGDTQAYQFTSGIFNELKWDLRNHILEMDFSMLGFEVYWERYGMWALDPGHFIFVLKDDTITDVFIKDGVTETHGTIQIFNNLEKISTTQTSRLVPLTVLNSAEFFDEINNPFGRSVIESPKAEMRNNVLIVNHQKRFIMKNVKFTYVKNPNKLSDKFGSYNHTFYDDEDIAEAIVQQTVLLIKNNIK